MCGILGFINPENITEINVASLLERLSHRGPDARGSFRDQHALLGHLRLSIIDLSDEANQPMHSHCGRFVMVYNGEIYNYREIQQQIVQRNPAFVPRTHSDSEIILEAFALWGADFVNRLNGMFAIAIWDKTDKKLFLFRDRLGVKPIYYYMKNGLFAFASELKVLTHEPVLKKHLTRDNTAINQFLHLGYIPAPHSVFTEIKKLPAGHRALLDKGHLSLHPYWRAEEKIQSSHALSDPGQALDELRELVESSVRYRLIADVPYGTFLSGGVDSSLVTAVAQSLHDSPINTFSIGFWDKDYDESGYAAKIARHLGTNHQSMVVTEKDALEWMPRLTEIYDEPYADSSAIPTLLVSQMARRHVTVTLSGDGGDELFMGYGAYSWAQRLSNPWVRRLKKPASLLLPFGPMKYRRAASLFHDVPDAILKSHIFSQEQYLFSRKEAGNFLLPEFNRDYRLEENFDGHLAQLAPAQQQALFDLKYYLPDDLLVKVDRASMHFALETRVPLLDYRIVEWALNLHPDLKIRQGQSKWLLKKLLHQYVPAALFDRPKRGFAIPLQKWLKTDLRDFAMDYLNEQAVRKAGVLNPKAVNSLLKAFYQKDQNYLYNKVWQLLVLQKWLQENDSQGLLKTND